MRSHRSEHQLEALEKYQQVLWSRVTDGDHRWLADQVSNSLFPGVLPRMLRAKNSRGLSSLHMASGHRDTAFVKNILDMGVPIDILCQSGKTALFFAIEHNNTGMIRLLLERGANANHRDSDGRTPLISWAISTASHRFSKNEFSENIPTLSFLLASGGNIDTKDNDGWGVLHYASFHGGYETAVHLLEHGADARSRNNLGQYPDEVGKMAVPFNPKVTNFLIAQRERSVINSSISMSATIADSPLRRM